VRIPPDCVALGDPEVLAVASEYKRVLVSHDVGTMPVHFRQFRNTGKQCSGVFLVPQHVEIATAIDELVLIWSASQALDWENRLIWLPL
jgi:hypothetical protein